MEYPEPSQLVSGQCTTWRSKKHETLPSNNNSYVSHIALIITSWSLIISTDAEVIDILDYYTCILFSVLIVHRISHQDLRS